MNITIMKMMRAAFVVGLFSPPQGLYEKNQKIFWGISNLRKRNYKIQ